MSFDMNSAAVVLSGLNAPNVVTEAVRGMRVGVFGGMDIYMDQNIKTHTAGTADANYTVDGASQAGSSLVVADGTGTLVVGDVITIADVNSVNPVSRVSTGNVKKFTVTAAYAGGAGTVSIAPAIVTSGAHQNVDAGPADDAAITVTAGHQANLGFHRNAFGLVMCPLEMPDGAAFKSRHTDDDVSIRVVKDYDIDTDEDIIRLDILYGVKTIYPELAARLYG